MPTPMSNPRRQHIWRTSRGLTFCGRIADRANLVADLPTCCLCEYSLMKSKERS